MPHPPSHCTCIGSALPQRATGEFTPLPLSSDPPLFQLVQHSTSPSPHQVTLLASLIAPRTDCYLHTHTLTLRDYSEDKYRALHKYPPTTTTTTHWPFPHFVLLQAQTKMDFTGVACNGPIQNCMRVDYMVFKLFVNKKRFKCICIHTVCCEATIRCNHLSSESTCMQFILSINEPVPWRPQSLSENITEQTASWRPRSSSKKVRGKVVEKYKARLGYKKYPELWISHRAP